MPQSAITQAAAPNVDMYANNAVLGAQIGQGIGQFVESFVKGKQEAQKIRQETEQWNKDYEIRRGHLDIARGAAKDAAEAAALDRAMKELDLENNKKKSKVADGVRDRALRHMEPAVRGVMQQQGVDEPSAIEILERAAQQFDRNMLPPGARPPQPQQIPNPIGDAVGGPTSRTLEFRRGQDEVEMRPIPNAVAGAKIEMQPLGAGQPEPARSQVGAAASSDVEESYSISGDGEVSATIKPKSPVQKLQEQRAQELLDHPDQQMYEDLRNMDDRKLQGVVTTHGAEYGPFAKKAEQAAKQLLLDNATARAKEWEARRERGEVPSKSEALQMRHDEFMMRINLAQRSEWRKNAEGAKDTYEKLIDEGDDLVKELNATPKPDFPKSWLKGDAADWEEFQKTDAFKKTPYGRLIQRIEEKADMAAKEKGAYDSFMDKITRSEGASGDYVPDTLKELEAAAQKALANNDEAAAQAILDKMDALEKKRK